MTQCSEEELGSNPHDVRTFINRNKATSPCRLSNESLGRALTCWQEPALRSSSACACLLLLSASPTPASLGHGHRTSQTDAVPSSWEPHAKPRPPQQEQLPALTPIPPCPARPQLERQNTKE